MQVATNVRDCRNADAGNQGSTGEMLPLMNQPGPFHTSSKPESHVTLATNIDATDSLSIC